MKSDQTILINELLDSRSVWIELTEQESNKQIGGFKGSQSALSPNFQVLATSEINLSQKWGATRFGDIALFISITSAYSP